MLRKFTSGFAAIGILGTWGFMAYAGLPVPWFLKPIGVVWSVSPFFAINLLARKWTRLRARAVWLLAAASTASITLQALYQMFIVDPRSEASAMFFVMPFFTYLAMIPFVIAAFVFEHPSND
ncbi:MAG TPA: hypothetical protein VFV51_19550 [Vicinamibacterales bacterium]|nr:hypothetical protein [Vicinamibacterales bacterium]